MKNETKPTPQARPDQLGNPKCPCWGTKVSPPMTEGECPDCGRIAAQIPQTDAPSHPYPESPETSNLSESKQTSTPEPDQDPGAPPTVQKPCHCQEAGAVIDLTNSGQCSRCGRTPAPKPHADRVKEKIALFPKLGAPFTKVNPAKDWAGRYVAFVVLKQSRGLWVMRRVIIEGGKILEIEENTGDLFGQQMGKIVWELEAGL